MMADPSNLLTSSKEWLAKVFHEKYAYVFSYDFVYPETLKDCRLSVIKENFFRSYTAFVVPSAWPYKKYFDKVWVILYNYFNKHMQWSEAPNPNNAYTWKIGM